MLKQYKMEQKQRHEERMKNGQNSTKWSTNKRREERMKKIDINFATKSCDYSRHALIEGKLELEMQMKELETKHHLLEEELELERIVRRTALENDDARPQTTSAQKNHLLDRERRKEDR